MYLLMLFKIDKSDHVNQRTYRHLNRQVIHRKNFVLKFYRLRGYIGGEKSPLEWESGDLGFSPALIALS